VHVIVSYAGVNLTSLVFMFSDVLKAGALEITLSITLQQSPLLQSLSPLGLRQYNETLPLQPEKLCSSANTPQPHGEPKSALQFGG